MEEFDRLRAAITAKKKKPLGFGWVFGCGSRYNVAETFLKVGGTGDYGGTRPQKKQSILGEA